MNFARGLVSYCRRGRLLAGLVAMATVALAMPLKAGAANTFNQQIPFTVVIANECPPGNPVSLAGNIHIMGSLTLDSAGGVHGNLSSNLDSISAFDTVTGTTYSDHDNGQTSSGFPPDFFKFNATPSTLEYTQDLHGGLISHGSDPNLNFQLRLHITIPPDGNISADVSKFVVTCK